MGLDRDQVTAFQKAEASNRVSLLGLELSGFVNSSDGHVAFVIRHVLPDDLRQSIVSAFQLDWFMASEDLDVKQEDFGEFFCHAFSGNVEGYRMATRMLKYSGETYVADWRELAGSMPCLWFSHLVRFMAVVGVMGLPPGMHAHRD